MSSQPEFPLITVSLEGDRSAAPEPARLRIVFLNLVLLIALGVLASGWVLYYTDWFPVVGGLLGLGGVFAWVAFVSGLLTGERKQQFQQQFETLVLQESRTWRTILVLGCAGCLWASLHGSIVLQSFGDDRDRVLEIRPAAGANKTAPIHLPSHTLRKQLVFTGWLGRAYTVKVSGLPAATLDVSPLGRATVASPASFSRHAVVLIRPTLRVSRNAERFPFELVVRRNGAVIGRIGRDQYRGETVWVGCDRDVQVPDRLIDRWRLELLQDKRAEELLVLWTAPLTVAENVELRHRDRIEAELLREDGGRYAAGTAQIRPLSSGLSSGSGFVQELSLTYRLPDSNQESSPVILPPEVENHVKTPPS